MPMPSSPPCFVCGQSKARLDFIKNGFKIFCCPHCGFKFVNPAPENTADIYSQEYFCGAAQGFGYVNYDKDKVAMKPFFEAALNALERYCPNRGRLLDVGAATGFFVKLAKARRWEAIGLEISSYAVKAAAKNGVLVIQGTLETSDFQPESFEVITLLDVIEHISDPTRMVERCARLLRPRGLLVINTPDASSLWARIFGWRWHAYCPPEHLSYFSPDNLGRLLHERGFEIQCITKLGKRFTPAYVFSMLFRWQKLVLWQWVSQRLEYTFFNRMALPINIRDNFFLIARRGL